MHSAVPKLLHPVCGRPMIGWPVAAARQAGAAKIVVVDSPQTPLAAHLDHDVKSVVQEQALGTGDALSAALPEISPEDTVVVLTGDTPLIRAASIGELVEAYDRHGAAAMILTAVLDEPGAYGRVVRDGDGHVVKVAEAKQAGDATELELAIKEVNSGIFVFNGAALQMALPQIANDNAQGEYYLPDVLPVLRRERQTVAAHRLADPIEMWGVNDRLQLAAVTREAQRRINEAHMLAGATLINPAATVIDIGVTLAEDVLIEPGCALGGTTSVGPRSVVGPHSTLLDTSVGADCRVVHSYSTGATIGDRVNVGPFASLRPGTILGAGAKAGTFVEIKNSDIGAGTKVPHLSYIGDADIGEDTNIAAANVTANYDGKTKAKSRTTIGSHVHTGVDTTFVAPVQVGDRAYTAPGSVIGLDVPADALAGSPGVARKAQTNIEGYANRQKQAKERA